MAKQAPFTTQQERLERRIANLHREVADIRTMVDPSRRVLAAEYVKVEGAASPQIIRVSEGGGLALGSEGSWEVVDVLTESESHTGDILETTLHTAVVPANKMGPNGVIRVSTVWDFDAGADGFIYWGQTLFPNNCFGYYANAGNQFLLDSCLIPLWNKNATNTQGSRSPTMRMHTNGWGLTVALAMTEDTTADVPIYFRIDNALPGDISYLHFVMVEALYRD